MADNAELAYEGIPPEGSWEDWDFRIEQAGKEMELWETQCRKIVKRYRDEREENPNRGTRRFNALWSNVETQKPLYYDRPPKPEIVRRHKDPDPVALTAAEVLERTMDYTLDDYDFDELAEQVVLDYILTARGIAWVRYEAEVDGEDVTYEQALCDYIDWRDFRHGVARCWAEVPWVARRHYYQYDKIAERFGEEIADEDLYESLPEDIDESEDFSRNFKRAQVWEIWDKETKKVVWFCPRHEELLDEHDPVVDFRDFYPCPRPLYGTLTNDSLIPVPDYVEYQDQAQELDILTARISMLTKALRVAGVYDASAEGLQRLIEEEAENELIPIDNWPRLAGAGGLKGSIDWLPIAEVATVLLQLYDVRERVKRDLAEITGLSDIMRGQADPGGGGRVTAREQDIKVRFGSLRTRKRQKKIQRFFRDILRLKVEIAAEMFSPQTLLMMSSYNEMVGANQNLFMAAVRLIRQDPRRGFRIDVETDSTIAEDEEREKRDRIEFLKVVAPFMKEAIIAIKEMPRTAPVVTQMLMFVMRGFKAGRGLEATLEQTLPGLTQELQGQRDKGEQGEERAQQAELQIKMKSEQGKLQVDQARLQIEQAKLQMDSQQFQIEMELKGRDLQQEGQIAQAKLDVERQKAGIQQETDQAKIMTERDKAVLDARTADAAGSLAQQQFDASDEMNNVETIRATQAMAEAATSGVQEAVAAMTQKFTELDEQREAPKSVKVLRDKDGRISGARVSQGGVTTQVELER